MSDTNGFGHNRVHSSEIEDTIVAQNGREQFVDEKPNGSTCLIIGTSTCLKNTKKSDTDVAKASPIQSDRGRGYIYVAPNTV